MSTTVETATDFHVDIPQDKIDDLRRRISATRWPSKELVDDRSQGVQLEPLQELARYWLEDYDFGRVEARLNALPQFQRFDANLLGISVDSIWSRLAFANDRHLQFPLLADFEPKGEVARTYGVYRQQDGTSERALFVIDGDGVVRWSYVSAVGINPGADGILKALEELP